MCVFVRDPRECGGCRYGTEDAATLSSAPRDQIDLHAYAVQLVDAAAYSLALVPLDASKKSWYIRAMDQARAPPPPALQGPRPAFFGVCTPVSWMRRAPPF